MRELQAAPIFEQHRAAIRLESHPNKLLLHTTQPIWEALQAQFLQARLNQNAEGENAKPNDAAWTCCLHQARPLTRAEFVCVARCCCVVAVSFTELLGAIPSAAGVSDGRTLSDLLQQLFQQAPLADALAQLARDTNVSTRFDERRAGPGAGAVVRQLVLSGSCASTSAFKSKLLQHVASHVGAAAVTQDLTSIYAQLAGLTSTARSAVAHRERLQLLMTGIGQEAGRAADRHVARTSVHNTTARLLVLSGSAADAATAQSQAQSVAAGFRAQLQSLTVRCVKLGNTRQLNAITQWLAEHELEGVLADVQKEISGGGAVWLYGSKNACDAAEKMLAEEKARTVAPPLTPQPVAAAGIATGAGEVGAFSSSSHSSYSSQPPVPAVPLPVVVQSVPLRTARLQASVEIRRGDIVGDDADALVNAANSELQHGDGVAGAFRVACGAAFQRDSADYVRKNGALAPGTSALFRNTGGQYRLPCRMVINTVGPRFDNSHNAEVAAQQLAHVQAACSAVNLAQQAGATSIALPAISTGIFGFPRKAGCLLLLSGVVDALYAQAKESAGAGASMRSVRLIANDAPTISDMQAALTVLQKLTASPHTLPANMRAAAMTELSAALTERQLSQAATSSASSSIPVRRNAAAAVSPAAHRMAEAPIDDGDSVQAHVQAEPLWRWSWQENAGAHAGQFLAYRDEHNLLLEQAYSRYRQRRNVADAKCVLRQVVRYIGDVPADYVVDFAALTQVNQSTGVSRKVQRQASQVKLPNGTRWYFTDPAKGRAQRFEDLVQADIERAYQQYRANTGPATMTLSAQQGVGRREQYQIDFAAFTQTNLESAAVKHISRQ